MEKQLNIPKLRFPKFYETWEKKCIGEIGEVRMCKRIFNEETLPTGEIPFFKIGSFGNQADAYISKELYTEYRRKYSFPKKGDILISAAGTIGRTVVYRGEDAYFQDSNIVWINNDNSVVSNEFLFFIYQIVKYNTEGGTIQRLYNSILKSTIFSCPSLSEQTKIANFLSIVDVKLAQQIMKKSLLERYKKGVMQKLFSQELRFKDEDGNDFPEWEEKKLREICTVITKGTTPTSIGFSFTDNGVRFIKIESLSEIGEIIPNKVAFISHECHQALQRSQLRENDILFSIAGALGRIGVVKKEILPANTNQALAIIRISDESTISVSYIAKYFNSDFIAKEIDGLKGGAAQMNLSLGQLNDLSIPIPNIQEQQKIASFLSSLDDKIAQTALQIEKMQQWKKGLLQQMFV
jgi:type I restriction enzyme S subunit